MHPQSRARRRPWNGVSMGGEGRGPYRGIANPAFPEVMVVLGRYSGHRHSTVFGPGSDGRGGSGYCGLRMAGGGHGRQ